MTTNQLDIALKCAEFFISLGQHCLQVHQAFQQRKRKAQAAALLSKKGVKKQKRVLENAENNGGQELGQAPKKPLTPYILYFRTKKSEFASKYPNLMIADLTKLVAKGWKQLKEEDRLPFLQQAKADRQRYQAQISNIEIQIQPQAKQNSPQNSQPLEQDENFVNPYLNNEAVQEGPEEEQEEVQPQSESASSSSSKQMENEKEILEQGQQNADKNQ